MSTAQANGIQIEFESLGEGEPLLLIMGLGAQLVMWPDELCQQLVARGFRVIRFDNRDIGLSSKITEGGRPPVRRMLFRTLLGRPVKAPYTLLDMADDTVGLMDFLGLRDAHVVGASMGGMIAQTMAIIHQSRVRSLTSIMSGPGDRMTFLGKRSAVRPLLRPPPRTREAFHALWLEFFRKAGGSGYPVDEVHLRQQTSRAWDRDPGPPELARQTAAIFASGDRRPALRLVRAPTLVIHGSDDPLIRPAAGRATARAIPRAVLRELPGMGHYLPRALWPVLVDEIARHCHGA
jgi:pimeloyl-ACP methyl ester carboxylesterase